TWVWNLSKRLHPPFHYFLRLALINLCQSFKLPAKPRSHARRKLSNASVSQTLATFRIVQVSIVPPSEEDLRSKRIMLSLYFRNYCLYFGKWIDEDFRMHP